MKEINTGNHTVRRLSNRSQSIASKVSNIADILLSLCLLRWAGSVQKLDIRTFGVIVILLPFPEMTRKIIYLLPITEYGALIWFPPCSLIKRNDEKWYKRLPGWMDSCYFSVFRSEEIRITSKRSLVVQRKANHPESSQILKDKLDVMLILAICHSKKIFTSNLSLSKTFLIQSPTWDIWRINKSISVTAYSEACGCTHALSTSHTDMLCGLQTHIHTHSLSSKCHNIIIMQYWSRWGWSIWIPIRMDATVLWLPHTRCCCCLGRSLAVNTPSLVFSRAQMAARRRNLPRKTSSD